MADSNFVTIGDNKSSKIGNTTVTGSGSVVKSSKPSENSVLSSPTNIQSNVDKSYSPTGSNPMTGVRSWMNNNGFDNSKIGYDSGSNTVTYDGKNFLSGGDNINGTTYSTDDVLMKAADSYYRSNGYSPVRDTLVDRNIDNSRIGYNQNNGNIMIDNYDTGIAPSVNVNGTTYADEGTINNLTQAAYASSGEPLVAGRDYATAQGYGGLVNWDGSNVTVGGVSIKPAYVTSSGVAYVPKSQIDSAIKNSEQRNGIIGNNSVVDQFNSRYGNALSDALASVSDLSDWRYDPNQDPVYEAYEQMYTRAADDAFRKTLNDNNSSLTNASGAVLSQAFANRNNYLTDLSNIIPELASDDYNRRYNYANNYLSTVDSLADDWYNRLYQSNRDSVSDARAAREYEDTEEQRWFNNDITSQNQYYNNLNMSNEIQKAYIELQYYDPQLAEQLRSAVLSNDQTEIDNIFSRAYMRGYFNDAEAASVGVPVTQIPWQGEVNYKSALNDLNINSELKAKGLGL